MASQRREVSKMEANKFKSPDWVKPALARILELEIRLGNIVADPKWQNSDTDTLYERATGMTEQDDYDDSVIESLFKKVCKALKDEGHEPEAIAAFINSEIRTGTKLKYCDETEVTEALA
jgi:hypothetical protein